MKEIGEKLKAAREEKGVSIKEAAEDLNMRVTQIENIEAGNLKSFKDVFYLKMFIRDYSKYLGLNPTEVLDEFNEYMFEKTSKLPIEKIEEAIRNDIKEESLSARVASPYTRLAPLKSNKSFVLTLLLIVVLVVLAVIWSIKQITVGNTVTNLVSFFVK